MRRSYLYGALAGGAALCACLAFYPGPSSADQKAAQAAEASGKSETESLLPVTRVVLFSSGVGHFQREGAIDGNRRVDLTFDVRDINDLLKSMTVQDLDGGHISLVSYDSNAPIDRTLASFAINLSANPGYGQILTQARGEKVEVVLQPGNAAQPATLTGSIVGVETKAAPAPIKDAPPVQAEHLNLWCADGLRSVRLSEVQRVRFLNPALEAELRKALETVALGHDTQKKAVSIHCEGDGKRRVRVGYVAESPVWKASYRLVLAKPQSKKDKGEVKAEAPTLQGWALVENVSDDDWGNVKMALISGRPISFRMNLYDPLFIPRPLVEPELFASLRPPTYSGGGFGSQGGLAGGGGGRAPMAPGAAPRPGDSYLREAEQAARKSGATKDAQEGWGRQLDEKLDLGKGVVSAASASKLGDYYQYVIEHPVTLQRQKSALLPVVQGEVKADRFSIYNERVHPKFPLLGVAFHNTSGMPLTQGPVTVFEGSSYAGDARILDLQQGERRLLSYAVDLGTEVQAVPHSDNGKLTSVKLVKGILHTTTRIKESRDYTAVNRSDIDRALLIEHPNRPDFKLTSKDKPWETAQDFHRFQVDVPAGQTAKFTVSEEKDTGSTVAFSNTDDNFIAVLLKDQVTSDKVKAALREAVSRKQKMGDMRRDLQLATDELKQLTDDQDRLRKNIREVPQDSEAYRRYVKKFDDQEKKVEALQEKLSTLRAGLVQEQKDLDNFLANLNAE